MEKLKFWLINKELNKYAINLGIVKVAMIGLIYTKVKVSERIIYLKVRFLGLKVLYKPTHLFINL